MEESSLAMMAAAHMDITKSAPSWNLFGGGISTFIGKMRMEGGARNLALSDRIESMIPTSTTAPQDRWYISDECLRGRFQRTSSIIGTELDLTLFPTNVAQTYASQTSNFCLRLLSGSFFRF